MVALVYFTLTKCKYLLQTALHWAAKHGKADMTTVMAEAGADINTKAVSTSSEHRHYSDFIHKRESFCRSLML